MQFVGKFLDKLFLSICPGITPTELFSIMTPKRQSAFVQRRRALLILSRVRLVAVTFAILTPLWIPIDFFVFGMTLAVYLAALRLFTSVAFVLLCVSFRGADTPSSARWALVWLLVVPTVFFLISHPLLGQFINGTSLQQIVAAGYAYLPFVMVAGLSVFPITATEGAGLSAPLLIAYLLVGILGYHVLPFGSYFGAFWLLFLLAVVATMAGMSQLHFMSQLVDQASHDGLTWAYNRRVGEEMVSQYFVNAARAGAPMALAFVDLDNFKSINDQYGHEDGDEALRMAAASLRRVLRRGDILIRWGGEEFVAVMANTDMDGAKVAVTRLQDSGLGVRPDGQMLTASVGVAERIADDATHWAMLVDKADQRMYAAKKSGKNRIVTGDSTPEAS